MQFTRQQVFGPKQGQVTALIVTTAGFRFELDSGYYSALVTQIRQDKPLMMTAESNAVYYFWSSNPTGTVESVNPAQSATGGGGTAMAAVIFPGVNPFRLEVAPRDTRALVAMATGGTAILRFWSGDA